MPTSTNWRLVALLILAGMVAAFQVGKAAVAMPLLRQDLHISLAMASWIIGAFATLGALIGLAAGVGVSVIGARRALITGLIAIGAGSLGGGLATTGLIVLGTRIVESGGFLAAVIAIPALLRAATAPADNDIVFTCWGAYMPAGTAVMMLAGPALASLGWQFLWLANGVIALAYAALLFVAVPRAAASSSNGQTVLTNVGTLLRTPGPALLALAFCLYTFQYFALTGLLPTLLVEQLQLSVAQAGVISAITVFANAFGNLAAGLLAKRNVPLWQIMASAFAFLGIAAFGIFSAWMPIVAIALIASTSLAISGLIPASIFAASPRLAGNATMLAITVGLLTQASGLGQFLGPAALGSFVQRFGWPSAPFFFAGITLAGIAVALRLRAVMRKSG
ncbi:MAG: MFS transporter [Rhizobiales bacterium]|nr:MFS transporter [Hyphomicrobiales bacterium]